MVLRICAEVSNKSGHVMFEALHSVIVTFQRTLVAHGYIYRRGHRSHVYHQVQKSRHNLNHKVIAY